MAKGKVRRSIGSLCARTRRRLDWALRSIQETVHLFEFFDFFPTFWLRGHLGLCVVFLLSWLETVYESFIDKGIWVNIHIVLENRPIRKLGRIKVSFQRIGIGIDKAWDCICNCDPEGRCVSKSDFQRHPTVMGVACPSERKRSCTLVRSNGNVSSVENDSKFTSWFSIIVILLLLLLVLVLATTVLSSSICLQQC